ncbi:MAG: hypothetical protein HY326_05555 [Chloroflexi bacterium]|nr:hypothetical protein [Chloroflexota bacterium]
MEEKSDRFDLVVTILIALVTTFGAVIAWQAALSLSAAGDVQQEGLLTILSLEGGEASYQTRLYTDLQYFVRYTEYHEMAQHLRQDETVARSRGETNLANDLSGQAEQNEALAENLEAFFDVSYIKPDGTFDEERRLADLRMNDAKLHGLNPQNLFDQADAFQEKARLLVGIIFFLTVTLLFYTLSQITESRIKYPYALLGSIIFVATIVAFVLVQRAF